MKPKLFIAVKAFILYDGRILIIRESSSNPVGTNSNKFDVPGGRVEPGEHFENALRREIMEETGLEVTIQKPLHVAEWRPVVKGEQWHIIGIYFKCLAASDAVTLGRDHDVFEWIDPKKFSEYEIIENIKSAFESYLA